jgi:hypothetical protein
MSVLNDRLAQMEQELHSERDRRRHLEQESDFYKKLLEEKKNEPQDKEV